METVAQAIRYEDRFETVYLDFNPMQFEVSALEYHPTYIMQDSYRIGNEAIRLMQSALDGENISDAKIIVLPSIVTAHSQSQTKAI